MCQLRWPFKTQKRHFEHGITLSDIPCLKDYEEVKRRLFVRLWNRERMQDNGAIYEPFLDLYFSCHIDVSDLVGATAFCMVKEGFAFISIAHLETDLGIEMTR